MANSSVESDDAFSRRLQAQEMGIMQPHSGIDAQTPLMVDGRVRHEASFLSNFRHLITFKLLIIFPTYNTSTAASTDWESK
jgi:hypothetical protein